METETSPVRKLETVTCGRCGGTGQYSYCQRYGTTCFKCGGAKVLYTKRGQVAADFYTALLSKRADQIVVGESFRETGVTNGCDLIYTWWKVIEIRPDTTLYNGVLRPENLNILGESKKFGTCGFCTLPDKVYRIAATVEQKKEALAKALDYQDTLTKQGTTRKNRGSK